MGEQQPGRTQRRRPVTGAETGARATSGPREASVPVVDNDLDRRILQTLSRDGRATLAHLAEATGLSVSAVQVRVQRLEHSGVIRGYSARLDPVAIGRRLKAFVEVTEVDPGGSGDIPGLLAGWDDVESCYSVSGPATYLLIVSVSGPDALDDLLRRIRVSLNVSTSATLALRTVFEDRPPVLDPVD